LNIQTEEIGTRQIRLTIEFEEDEEKQAMRRAARRISREVDIPGFRKGKAPYDVVIQRFGEQTVRSEAAEMMAEETFTKVLEQEGIEPFAPPDFEGLELNPITYEFTVPLHPVVDLGDYRDYRREPPEVEVTEEEVEHTLQHIREDNAVLDPVERPAELGDQVILDIESEMTEGGEEFISGEEFEYVLDPENKEPVPGFAEKMVGIEADEERTFTLTLPDDFEEEDFQGKEVEFTAVVHEVYNMTLPDLDDDLARTVGNYDSMEELREEIEEQLLQQAQQQAEQEYRQQVIDDIVEQAEIEYPPVLLEEELDQVVDEVEQSIKQRARLALEDFLRIQGQDMEEFREELKPQAEERVEQGLVLGTIVDEEELEVTDEEIESGIDEASAQWGDRAADVRAQLSTEEGKGAMRNRILTNKAVQRLVDIAKGEASGESPEPGEEEPAEEEEIPEEEGNED